MGKAMTRFGLKRFLFVLGFMVALGSASAQAQGQFGALSLSPEGAWGYSASFATIDIAQDRAVEECRKYGKGCQIVRVFQNVCVAVARNEDSKNVIVNWVSGYNAAERTRRALANCRNDGGTDCRILKEFCTGDAR
ncbi:MAG: DUF4189 domain-containing protein [Xanthobacteraceae bacterium]|nr:DUF4189 domain-containing protein [Xanthobacteraceae bacterium]MCW5675714.1 DUF4189 domain-containing protein [Xanthobacteraceae bacterium]